MAAAEARAVWQRSANRYFIQEDAKRAPKLACCPSISSVVSKTATKPVNPADLNDSFPVPNDKSFFSNQSSESKWWNQSSESKWWIQLQPDYMYQRGLSGDQVIQFNPLDSRNPHQFVENQDNGSISSVDLLSKESYEFVQMDSVELLKIKCSQNTISRGESRPDTSKTKILEALCHSQTRAREAEIAAKKAYAEKEHAIKLVFRQASQLFAYRQWIYVLQLENLCYQMKNNKSDLTSSVRAFSPSRIGKPDANLKSVVPAKGKRRRTKHGFGGYGHDLGKYAVFFVVGLGIVGAGLVLGWTVGWMLI